MKQMLLLIYAKLDFIYRALTRKLEIQMAVIDDLTAQVAKNTDVIESALTLIANIKAALDAAGTDPAKLAALSATLGAEDDKLAAVVAANTPAAPAAPKP